MSSPEHLDTKLPSSLAISIDTETASSRAETEATFRRARTPSMRVQEAERGEEDTRVFDDFLRAFGFMAIMAVLSIFVLIGRQGTASEWAGLMEAAGFEQWPRTGGSKIQIAVCIVSIAAPGVALFMLCCLAVARRCKAVYIGTIVVLVAVVLVAVVAACIGSVAVIIGTPDLSNESIRLLAAQSVPAANFNRGYCQAWCRHEGDGLASLLKGECGEDKATVFDDVLNYFQVGDWCKEAIAHQNFDILASYSGTAPLANLTGRPQAFLASTTFSDILSVVNGLLSIALLCSLVGRTLEHSK